MRSRTQAGFGVVMMGARAAGHKHVAHADTSTPPPLDLKFWRNVTDAYLEGRPVPSEAILPTEELEALLGAMGEMRSLGWGEASRLHRKLGKSMRILMHDVGLTSVASAEPYAAPGVIVVYVDDAAVVDQLRGHGVGAEEGIPLQLGEKLPFPTFRMGVFGLDKMRDIDGTVRAVERAFEAILAARPKAQEDDGRHDDDDDEL